MNGSYEPELDFGAPARLVRLPRRRAGVPVLPLLNDPHDLGPYFEVYPRGGDYVLGDDRIVVYADRSAAGGAPG